MLQVEVEVATPAHVLALARHLRDADRAEIWAAAGVEPAEALDRSLAASPLAWTALMDGTPACMFGVGKGGPDWGRPWMLGTDLVERHASAFLRRCHGRVAAMQDSYPLLINHVDARNATSLRWLGWLGFTIGTAAPWGVFGLPFHPFWRRRHV